MGTDQFKNVFIKSAKSFSLRFLGARIEDNLALMVTSAPSFVDGLLVLDLQITDPEIIHDLTQHQGEERSSYAVAALRLGLMALRQARGELDVAALKYESARFLAEIERTLSTHANSLIGNLSGELARYFDPSTGNVSQRIERLIKDGGELDLLLRQHLAGR